jgi:hypothetical protein
MASIMASKKKWDISARISKALLLAASAVLLMNPEISHPRQEVTDAKKGQSVPRSDTEIYAGVKFIVDLTPEELVSAFPEEMRNVKLDENRELLSEILAKTGERVEGFFRDFPKTLANEQVRMERLDREGRVDAATTRNYLYSFSLDKTGAFWEETRTERNGRPIDMKSIPGFLLAPGRAGLTAFLHPRHQAGSRFRYLGRDTADPGAHLIAFAQKPEARDYLSSYQSEGMAVPAPLLFQGLAWVHPENYEIMRMRTDLLAPRTDIGLSRQTTEIWFSEVHFESVAQGFWLPREVLITNKSATMSTRNRHRYAQYQVFTVSVEEKFMPVKKQARQFKDPGPD